MPQEEQPAPTEVETKTHSNECDDISEPSPVPESSNDEEPQPAAAVTEEDELSSLDLLYQKMEADTKKWRAQAAENTRNNNGKQLLEASENGRTNQENARTAPASMDATMQSGHLRRMNSPAAEERREDIQRLLRPRSPREIEAECGGGSADSAYPSPDHSINTTPTHASADYANERMKTPEKVKCSKCKGKRKTGSLWWKTNCIQCKGIGRVDANAQVECPNCKGKGKTKSGWLFGSKSRCIKCFGNGKVVASSI